VIGSITGPDSSNGSTVAIGCREGSTVWLTVGMVAMSALLLYTPHSMMENSPNRAFL
jgi:hypothetical protein